MAISLLLSPNDYFIGALKLPFGSFCYIAIGHGPVEIVDFPIHNSKNGVFFSSSLCKRLPEGNCPMFHVQP